METTEQYTPSPSKQKQMDQQAIPVIREELKKSEDHLLLLIDCVSEINPTLRPYLKQRIMMKRVDIAALEIKLEKLMRNVGL
jgi:hypothetical protein